MNLRDPLGRNLRFEEVDEDRNRTREGDEQWVIFDLVGTPEKRDGETEDATPLLILCDGMEDYPAHFPNVFSLSFLTAKQESIRRDLWRGNEMTVTQNPPCSCSFLVRHAQLPLSWIGIWYPK